VLLCLDHRGTHGAGV